MRPSIFISSVTAEFKNSRDIVAKVLLALGYTPVWQDIFGTEAGDLRAVLRKKIDSCQAVIQLVGFRYGVEPPSAGDDAARLSCTQYEAEYATERGKRVWYFVDEGPPSSTDEPLELRELQEQYRRGIVSGSAVYYQLHIRDDAALKNAVHGIRDDLARFRRGFRRWGTSVTVLLLMILGSVFYLLFSLKSPFDEGLFAPETRLSASTGAWAWDRFVGVRVTDAVTGTLLGDEPYELEVELKNRTSMPLLITQTTVLSRNEEASQLFGTEDPQVFQAEIHVTIEVGPHKTDRIPVRLNEILPDEITVRVFHNRSELPSEFNIDLCAQALPMPHARHLSRNHVQNGYDSLEAIRRTAHDARKWSADAKVIAAIPGDHKVYIDPESRLQYTIVDSWVITFFSRARNRIYMAVASAGQVDGNMIQRPPEPREVPLPDLKEPEIGYQRAVELADQLDLLCADWKTVALRAVEVGGKGVPAWFLPYRGPSGLPLMIDATTGMQLVPAAGQGFRTLTRETSEE